MAFVGSDFTGKGNLGIKVNRVPKAPLSWRVKNALRFTFIWGWFANKMAKSFSRVTGIPTLTAQLSLKLFKADGSIVDYGVVSYRVITTAFVNFMVDQMQAETAEWGDLKFHDSGEGSTAEAVGDTDIETTDGESRATGTQGEGASANIYQTVGTISYTTTKAIVEHGIFSQVTGGTLMDRSVFSVVNVSNGDSIQFTYEYTANSGT